MGQHKVSVISRELTLPAPWLLHSLLTPGSAKHDFELMCRAMGSFYLIYRFFLIFEMYFMCMSF